METGTKLSNMIILILVLTLIISGMGVFMSGLNASYSVNDDVINNISTTFLTENQNTLNRLENASAEMLEIEEDANLLDRLSSFFRAGYDTGIVIIGSFSSFGRLINTGVSNIPFLGSYSALLISILSGIILVIVVVRIFLHFLIKSDKI